MTGANRPSRSRVTAAGTMLGRRAAEQPERSAFIDGFDGRRLRWGDLGAHAQHWRRLVRERGLEPRSRVGLVADDPLAFAAAYLSCLGAGIPVVPVSPHLAGPELATIVAEAHLDVLAAADPEALCLDADVETWAIGLDGPAPRARPRAWRRRAAASAPPPAVLLRSSGTTGAAKGIPLSLGQLLDAAGRVVRHHRLTAADRGHTALPLVHVNAQVVGLLSTLLGGGSLVIEGRFDRAGYWERVAEWAPTWLNAVPAILGALAEMPAPPGRVAAGIRFARSASAALPPTTLAAFERRAGVGVLESYGMTEAAGQICANPLDEAGRRPASVGPPVGIDLDITGPERGPAAPGEVGEVTLGGPQVVRRYLVSAGGDERSRSARDRSGRLPTGDLAFRDDEGHVHLVGRIDDVINRGGEKLYPVEVENVLLAHPGVAAAAVVAAPHERLGSVPVAFVATRPGVPADRLTNELRRLCADLLSPHKRPAEIRIGAALPVGPTGKVLRRRLRDATGVAA